MERSKNHLFFLIDQIMKIADSALGAMNKNDFIGLMNNNVTL